MKELLMGNEAIAVGALMAGVGLVCGYPGTPSTEVLETVAKRNPGGVHVEWSDNEKVAMEVAAGAAYSGIRSLVTMKQMGLNVAADPAMTVNYIGVKGGMVLFVADDPGPISSQTEQDTRHFASFAKIPVFDPTSPEEAFSMIQDAFAFSEEHKTPVILRATTRICHSCASLEISSFPKRKEPEGFVKDPGRFVIFPGLSYRRKQELEQRETVFSQLFSDSPYNAREGKGKWGIACGGDSYAYVKEALDGREEFTVWKVGNPFPFPEKAAEEFLSGVEKVLVLEELDPVIEDGLMMVKGRNGISTPVFGKRTQSVPCAGELSTMMAKDCIHKVFAVSFPQEEAPEKMPVTPVRPPVLCPGCPHRGSFYAVKKAMEGKEAVFAGDIGCYTLGNAMPLNMVDTCLCMGAGITIPQGIYHGGQKGTMFGFVGDSTFFASAIPGIINAVYNQADLVVVVLDNSTTAMTGHQPHPGTGRTMMGQQVKPVQIKEILKACGVSFLGEANPFHLEESIQVVKEAAEKTGVRAILFKAPCIALEKKGAPLRIQQESCIGCKKCLKELGCPAFVDQGKTVGIDPGLCNGCGLCTSLCPKGCIGATKEGEV